VRPWVRRALVAAAVVAAGTGAWVVAGQPVPAGLASHLPGPLARLVAPKPEAPKDAGKPDFDVRVATAATETVPVAFQYTGVIVSPKDAALQPRVTGIVTERPFEPGGTVKKGQILFRIDPRPFEVALQTAEAQRQQALAQLAFAGAEVERTQPLADKGYASEQRFQQLESNKAVAASRVKEAEASIARQKLNLEFAVIRAPFDGRASISDVNIGDLVNENTSQLVSVVQVDPIEVQVALSSEDSEAVRGALADGKASIAVLSANGQEERQAEIYRLDNRFDPRTARRLVRAWLSNGDERYLPGQFVRTRVQVGTEERLLVPTVALSAQLDQRIVWSVADDGTVTMVPVETGEAYGDRTAIVNGLKPGTRIAVDHLQLLRQNQKVGLRRDDPAAESRAAADRRAANEAAPTTR
jgi:RND family efflux transporter MFP subunit